MLPINPQNQTFKSFEDVLKWAQSVYKAFAGGVEIATPNSTNAAGVYNSFTINNLAGHMVRIGAYGSGAPIAWTSRATAVINHGLLKQPIGFILCDIDGNATVWRTAVPNADTISLQISNNAVNVTIFIF